MNERRDDIRRARSGDREAIDRLLARCSDRLQRHAQARVGDGLRPRVRISDLLQSTYLDVLRSVDRFDGITEDDFVAWVIHALENNIRDKVKFYGRDKRKRAEVPFDDSAEGGKPGPVSELSLVDEADLVRRAMVGLTEDHRRVIELRLLQGKSHRETAAVLERTEEATRSLLVRARAALLVEVQRLRRGDDPAAPT